MAEPTAAHARELSDYLSLARRRWVWIASCLVAGVALSLVYLSTAQPTYVATSKVLVRSTGSDTPVPGARTNDAINLDTEAQLVTSADVSARASDLLVTSLSPVSLANRVRVAVPANTTILDISFLAPSAVDAQRGASEFAQAYLENRQDSAQEVLSSQLTRLQDQIKKTSGDIEETSTAISRMDGSKGRVDRAFLVARRDTLSNELASYNAELAPLVGAGVDAGRIIADAQLPRRPVDPNPLLILPTGLMAGLALGLGLAAWRQRADKRVHDVAEVERVFGLTPLSTLSAAGPERRSRIDHDVRALYYSLPADDCDLTEVVLLVAPDSPETADHLAYALALVAARSGASTTHLTRPRSPVVLDRSRSDVERSGSLRLADYEDVGALVDGQFRPADFRQKLEGLCRKNDVVVLGLPNNDPAVDVPILGRHVDVMVVVVRLGVSTRDGVARLLADVTKSGVDRVALVTVDLGRRGLRRRRVEAAEAFGVHSERTETGPMPSDVDVDGDARPEPLVDRPTETSGRREDQARVTARQP